MKWEILDTGVKSGCENMDLDSDLLSLLSQKKNPILHLYDWKGDSATFGYFTDPFRFLDKDGVQKVGLSLARRPTGGGIVFHTTDLAFSVLIPSSTSLFSENTLQNYACVNQVVKESVCQFLGEKEETFSMTKTDFTPLDAACSSFCMARPTRYDVIWGGKKVAGAAQRKTKHGLLHQGTISITAPPAVYLAQVLKKDSKVQEAMEQYTFSLFPSEMTKRQLEETRKELKQILIHNFTKVPLEVL